jgi:L-malate glycosyltransferase
MKIVIYTEIYDAGGIDTFLINMIREWPCSDDYFIIVYNPGYHGISNVRQNVGTNVEFLEISISSYTSLYEIPFAYKIIREITSPILRYLLILKNVIEFIKFFKNYKEFRLMVVNGGYPGGDTCRAATIAWGLLYGRSGNIHNFHNMVVKPRSYHYLQEVLIDYLVAKSAGNVVTVSKAALDTLSLRPIIAAKASCSFVYNGISVEYISDKAGSLRGAYSLSDDVPILTMLATYEERKGHEFVLKTINIVRAAYPEVKLFFFGYGSAEQIRRVYDLVLLMGLRDNVFLNGFDPDIDGILRDTNVLVIGSQEYESFGFTAIEAMLRGIPVVSTNTGGLDEVIAQGEGGYKFSREDYVGMSAAVINLLGSRKTYLEQSELGKNRVRTNFSAKIMASKYHMFFDDQ